MTNINNNVHNNGVERVNSIMDNQQKKESFNDFLSRLHQFEKEFFESTANAKIQTKTKKTIDNAKIQDAYTKLHEMAQMQNELDTFIIKSRNIEINNTELTNKLETALHVELFEMLNECRSLFKYWSGKPENKSMILEEYADGIHFMLSIGNHKNLKDQVIEAFATGLFRDLSGSDNSIIPYIRRIILVNSIQMKSYYYGVVAQLLNFDMKMIWDAYQRKNQKNIQRQNDGY